MKSGMMIISVLFMLSSCSASASAGSEAEASDAINRWTKPVSVMANKKDSEYTPYNLYFWTDDYRSAPYEPEEGSYLGANIMKDRVISSDMDSFDELSDKKHALYANDMILGDNYPYLWILECASKEKTPLLTVNPPNGHSPFQNDLLQKTAKDAGKLNLPVFIQFYPYKAGMGYDKKYYINFFREAYDLFKKYAPNSIFVWGAFYGDVYDGLLCYPGDDYVDWVGINIVRRISSEEDYIYEPIKNELEYFYFSLQKRKPIMIANLSISHFSTTDMLYYKNEAASEISKIYTVIAEKYPRIKAVIYNSFNEMGYDMKTGEERNYDNFLIDDEEIIINAYREGAGDVNYLSDLRQDVRFSKALMLSPFPVYERNEKYYICGKSLEYDLKIVGMSMLKSSKVIIAGSDYYSFDDIKKYIDLEYELEYGGNIVIY